MREHSTTLWKVAQASDVHMAVTWLYRFVMLGLVTLLALNQGTAPPAEVLNIVGAVVYSGLVIAGWYLIVPPAVTAYKIRQGVDE